MFLHTLIYSLNPYRLFHTLLYACILLYILAQTNILIHNLICALHILICSLFTHTFICSYTFYILIHALMFFNTHTLLVTYTLLYVRTHTYILIPHSYIFILHLYTHSNRLGSRAPIYILIHTLIIFTHTHTSILIHTLICSLHTLICSYTHFL